MKATMEQKDCSSCKYFNNDSRTPYCGLYRKLFPEVPTPGFFTILPVFDITIPEWCDLIREVV